MDEFAEMSDIPQEPYLNKNDSIPGWLTSSDILTQSKLALLWLLWTIPNALTCCDLVSQADYSTLSSPWGEEEKPDKPVPSTDYDALL